MTDIEINAAAERIADRLFTSGGKEIARRLVLEGEGYKNLGGWCREGVVSQIIVELKWTAKRAKQKRKAT